MASFIPRSGAEGADCLDETYRSYRDKILNTDARVLEFSCNVHDKAEIVLDKGAFCAVIRQP